MQRHNTVPVSIFGCVLSGTTESMQRTLHVDLPICILTRLTSETSLCYFCLHGGTCDLYPVAVTLNAHASIRTNASYRVCHTHVMFLPYPNATLQRDAQWCRVISAVHSEI